MIELEDACAYLGIEADYMDDAQQASVERSISVAEMWLKGAAGANVDLDSPVAEELMLMAVAELYEDRGVTDERLSRYSGVKALASLKRMTGDMLLQLKYADFGEGDGE